MLATTRGTATGPAGTEMQPAPAERRRGRIAARLRDEVDLGALRTELVDTTRRAVHPSGASPWSPAPPDAVAEAGQR